MLIATWNVNHRFGKTRFRPEAVNAIAALQADVVVLTEYYPRNHHIAFWANLADAGWPYSIASESVGDIANRVLIASRFPLEPLAITPPTFDCEFPSNILSVTIPAARLRLVGVRTLTSPRIDLVCLPPGTGWKPLWLGFTMPPRLCWAI